jgi:hypothetical protein
MSDETIGDVVDDAEAAHPGSIHRYGMTITYLGSVDLSDWVDQSGAFRTRLDRPVSTPGIPTAQNEGNATSSAPTGV